MATRPAIRRTALAAAVLLLCGVGAVGIVAMVADDVDTAGQVFATAASFALFFSTAYVQGSLIRRGGAFRALGWLAVIVSAAAFVVSAIFIWGEDFGSESAARVWGSLAVASVAGATFALLLRRRQAGEPRFTTAVLCATLAVTVALAGLLIYMIAGDRFDDETLARATGVALILYALGLVMLPVARTTGRPPHPVEAAPR
jgi:hypothetical protein